MEFKCYVTFFHKFCQNLLNGGIHKDRAPLSRTCCVGRLLPFDRAIADRCRTEKIPTGASKSYRSFKTPLCRSLLLTATGRSGAPRRFEVNVGHLASAHPFTKSYSHTCLHGIHTHPLESNKYQHVRQIAKSADFGLT